MQGFNCQDDRCIFGLVAGHPSSTATPPVTDLSAFISYNGCQSAPAKFRADGSIGKKPLRAADGRTIPWLCSFAQGQFQFRRAASSPTSHRRALYGRPNHAKPPIGIRCRTRQARARCGSPVTTASHSEGSEAVRIEVRGPVHKKNCDWKDCPLPVRSKSGRSKGTAPWSRRPRRVSESFWYRCARTSSRENRPAGWQTVRQKSNSRAAIVFAVRLCQFFQNVVLLKERQFQFVRRFPHLLKGPIHGGPVTGRKPEERRWSGLTGFLVQFLVGCTQGFL